MRSRSAGCQKSALGSHIFAKSNNAFSANPSRRGRQNLVGSFADLLKALPSFQCSDFWTVLNKGSKVFFLDLSLQSAPAVRTSVIVSTDLRVEVFFGETGVRKCGDVLVPEKLCDLRDLKSVLHMIEQTRKDISTERSEKARHLLTLVSTLLEEVSGKHFACELQEWHLEVLKFLKSQVDLVLNDAGRYPPIYWFLLAFCSQFHLMHIDS